MLVRGARERPFDDEDRAVAELFLAGFGELWQPYAPWVAALPPSLRRVLEALLVGASEAEVAARLGISYATAHQYVVEVYRRGRVSSRGELMARFGPTV